MEYNSNSESLEQFYDKLVEYMKSNTTNNREPSIKKEDLEKVINTANLENVKSFEITPSRYLNGETTKMDVVEIKENNKSAQILEDNNYTILRKYEARNGKIYSIDIHISQAYLNEYEVSSYSCALTDEHIQEKLNDYNKKYHQNAFEGNVTKFKEALINLDTLALGLFSQMGIQRNERFTVKKENDRYEMIAAALDMDIVELHEIASKGENLGEILKEKVKEAQMETTTQIVQEVETKPQEERSEKEENEQTETTTKKVELQDGLDLSLIYETLVGIKNSGFELTKEQEELIAKYELQEAEKAKKVELDAKLKAFREGAEERKEAQRVARERILEENAQKAEWQNDPLNPSNIHNQELSEKAEKAKKQIEQLEMLVSLDVPLSEVQQHLLEGNKMFLEQLETKDRELTPEEQESISKWYAQEYENYEDYYVRK